MEERQKYDVIIVGAGPAGLTAAYLIAKKGHKVALLEKHTFPRDKICGDALSPDVNNQLHMIDSTLGKKFLSEFKAKKSAKAWSLYSPAGEKLLLPLKNSELQAFVSKRQDFDNFLFEHLGNSKHLSFFPNCKINHIKSDDKVIVSTNLGEFESEIILGADGAQSQVKKHFVGSQIDRKHQAAGLRQYYKGISGLEENTAIELHFYKEILPGYLWIFPLPNGEANVGIGMSSESISKQGVNLKQMMADLIKSHPNLKERFKNATELEKPKGFGLPLGSKQVVCSGNRFLLLGDAANLIDPFTGEGIGNAIRSGRIAADHVEMCIQKNRFDADYNLTYKKEIYKRMGSELRLSSYIQKMLKFPFLFDVVVRRANKNDAFRTLLMASMEDVDIRKKLKSFRFYLRLIFG